jgi:TolC family type I secretion outer membrane protein
MRNLLEKSAKDKRRFQKRQGLGNFALAGLGFVLATAFVPTTANAESLASALKAAYMHHPGLKAERARQRGTDENIAQAKSGWRPTVIANGDAGIQWSKSTGFPTAETNPAGVSITLNQPIFRGFKTVSGTKQARAIVAAGRQQLLSVEQQILLDAATAYMDVIRDRTIVRLRGKNVSVLASQLSASNARFSVGEITRTDVAQSRARLASARADLAVARANLASSVAAYIRSVGHRPRGLRYPRISRSVPRSLKQSLYIASKTSPQILAAAFNLEAARQSIEVVKGDLMPNLSLQAQFSFRHDPSSITKRNRTGIIKGVLSVPLYQAGRVHSQVRQARHQASQRQLQILDARRQVRRSVVSSWNAYVASGQTIAAINAQVSASALALNGVRQEALVGSRTTLDILDAERELVNSKVTLASARRNKIVAAYQLIASIGRMTARHLRLSVPIYNAKSNARKVGKKWIGTSIK